MGEWLTQFCGGSFVFQHLKQLERKVRTLEVHKDRVSEVSLSLSLSPLLPPSLSSLASLSPSILSLLSLPQKYIYV